jgi:uncharacterized membrane protein YqaE (UPF0057 family)
MKRLLILLLFVAAQFHVGAVVPTQQWVKEFQEKSEIQALNPEMTKLAVDDFLNLTPRKYREITGERLGLVNTVKLKAAQKVVKKAMKLSSGSDDGITKGIYVLLAIIGLGWLAMGIKDDWEGSDWLVNLILTCLCGLPGIIHALIKMKKYY